MDSNRPKLSGLTNCCVAEKTAPAMPPNDAPIANASSFTLRVLIPIALAAISSSRDRFPRAAKARILQAEIDHDDADGDQQQEVVVLLRSGKRHAENDLGPREEKAADAKRIDQLTPCGPLVMLRGALRLFRKMRMISPNRALRWRDSRRELERGWPSSTPKAQAIPALKGE